MENSKIEWTDHTFNPWIGCTKVSPACDHCYAEALMDTRLGRVVWGAERSRTSPGLWRKPVQWQRQAVAFHAEHGRRQRVFCASLADVFDNQVPAQWRAELFDLIRATPDLDWLLLTKRIGNADGMANSCGGLPDNVWLGATVVTQNEWDRDVPKLIATAAAVRFVSMEPLLGPVDMTGVGQLNWVIVGGESGQGARPMNSGWAWSLRDQCAGAGVPFLFKQWGEHGPDGRHVGKRAAGRLLDGLTHDGFPLVA